ncbi:MAG: hypothetical protein V4481_02610 [Patescibacteria group bacterium]
MASRLLVPTGPTSHGLDRVPKAELPWLWVVRRPNLAGEITLIKREEKTLSDPRSSVRFLIENQPLLEMMETRLSIGEDEFDLPDELKPVSGWEAFQNKLVMGRSLPRRLLSLIGKKVPGQSMASAVPA